METRTEAACILNAGEIRRESEHCEDLITQSQYEALENLSDDEIQEAIDEINPDWRFESDFEMEVLSNLLTRACHDVLSGMAESGKLGN